MFKSEFPFQSVRESLAQIINQPILKIFRQSCNKIALKGLGHEIELKFLTNMNGSRSKLEHLLVFGFLRCSSEELLQLPFSQRLS
jgi:hypothetical protein